MTFLPGGNVEGRETLESLFNVCEYIITAETVRELYGDWLDKLSEGGVE